MISATAEQKLAILGGTKVIQRAFKKYNPIGKNELDAATAVIESGVLSKFLGCWDEDFYGGIKVQEFERAWESYFNVKHAISVNSLTSGLIAAVGAIDIEPGDEIIVTPWTMSATATAILHWNAIPVFADIEDKTFCLDPNSVEANISPHTKAIIAADIFGHSANTDALMSIAKKHNLKLISDTAQAPGALYKNKFAGTLASLGGYSLNYHKHIHTGEGGVMVTNDDKIAEKLLLIRNHGEAVVGGKGVSDIINIIGYNFRLGEIEAAIGIEQLKKLPHLVESRQKIAKRLSAGLKDLQGLQLPHVEPDSTHVYYVYPLVMNPQQLGISRDNLCRALQAEGLGDIVCQGYTNIHLLPIYQKKIAYGSSGFPWSSNICKREISYAKGICPVAENLHDTRFFYLDICQIDLNENDIDNIIHLFHKVWNNLAKLV